jgi:hypothetical protein
MPDSMIVALEDVLIQGDRPLDAQVAMYKALAGNFRSIVLSCLDRDEAKRIMQVNRIRYDIFLTKEDSILTDTSWKVSAVRECLSVGWHIAFYLDVDPNAIREVYSMGITSMLLSHHLLRPSWLPTDGPPRAWDDLVQFSEAQRERSTQPQQVGGGGRRGGWPLDE